jgi:hypothetical protein
MSQDPAPGFSEIMWFKKGEADAEQAVADPAAPVDSLPIEDRYHDDGSITRGDLHRFSLRTGSTRQVPSLRSAPAKRGLSERALIAELDRTRVLRLAIALSLAVAAILALAVLR